MHEGNSSAVTDGKNIVWFMVYLISSGDVWARMSTIKPVSRKV